MAYREVARMDIDQVIRRWLAGEKIRAIARLTGLDRNTIRRIVRSAEKAGCTARGAVARRGQATSDSEAHRSARCVQHSGGCSAAQSYVLIFA